jgi:SAM-dependent methyltransferase
VDDPHRIVASGYDRMADLYDAEAAASRTDDTYFHAFLERCLDLIPQGGRALDLGCGAGRVAAEIARRARVVGVDISTSQVRLARKRAPTGWFVVADMSRLAFRSDSFDAIAAFYSVIHLRRDLQTELLRQMHAWLRPGGVLFGTFGSSDNLDERAEFFGEPMYWSHFDAEITAQLLSAAGFSVVQAEIIEDQGERPLWVIATASADSY